MSVIEVKTQTELDKALASVKSGDIIACVGKGSFRVSDSASVRAWGSASVRASGSASVEASGSASVRAWGSASVRAWESASVEASGSASVEAWGSASVEAWESASVEASGSASVRAWGSASVRAWESASVEAWGSASVEAWESASVRASGSASVRAWGSASVRASKYVAVTVDHRKPCCKPTISGGVLIEIQPPETARDWCEIYGVPIGDDGLVTLYKGVDDDYATSHSRAAGIFYVPGSTPAAPDWDGGKAECGGGLHFSPHAFMARRYAENTTRFVACPIRLDEIVVHTNAEYPDKTKAPRVAAPIWEVDADGNCIEQPAEIAS